MHLCAAQQHEVIQFFFRVPWPAILWRWNARYDDAIITFVLFLFFLGRGGISISSPLFIVHICGYRQCPKISLLLTVGTDTEDLSLHGVRGKIIQV